MAAVDLGAQSGRVALGRFDGTRLTLTGVRRFANVPTDEDGTLRWDLPALERDVLDGLRAVAREETVDSVAVDSWAVDFGLLDREGRILANPVHYRDRRRASAFPGVLARVPARELYERTGIQLIPINTVFELAALADEDDPVLAAADTLLLVPDLFHHRLCGSRTTEHTNATTTQCLDAGTGEWTGDLLERLDIPTGLLPEIVAPGTPLGRTTPEIAEVTGVDATVVAVGTHDTASAVAAVPFRGRASAFLSVGTWSLVGLETDRPLITDEGFAANLTNEGGIAGTVRLLRNVTGLWLLEECRRNWAEDGFDHPVAELVELARAAPALRSFVDPDDPVFAAPGDMAARVVEFCARTGQAAPDDAGTIVRCILESLALKHARTIDLLVEVTGRELTELHLVGGGARNDLLCDWTAQAAGLPVIAGPEEATLIGNLLVQAMALGELASLDEARQVSAASFVSTTHEPKASDEWREARDRFARVIAARSELVGA